MKEIVTYLNFDGNCREAMSFYAAALGGKLDMMEGEGEYAGRLVHARLSLPSGGALMASDIQGGIFRPLAPGNNFSLAIDCSTAAEQDSMFNMLGEGGRVTMELQHTFWGARYGIVLDRYGISWMFNLAETRGSQT